MKGEIDPRLVAFSSELAPRDKTKRCYEVIRPKAGQTVSSLCLSDRPLISRSHFQDDVSYVCLKKENGCPWCMMHMAPRIKGYLAGYNVTRARFELIELTDYAMHSCDRICKTPLSLRGKICKIRREGKKPNGRCVCWFEEDPVDTIRRKPFPPFDVMEAVLAMWDVPKFKVHRETGEAIPLDAASYFPEELNPDLSEPAQGDEDEPE